MEDIRTWLLEWFEDNSDVLSANIKEDENYVESGWIDSFQFLDLISAVEERFGVFFSDDDFAKEKLLTIRGMMEIISDKQ